MREYLAELTAWDPSIASAIVLRYSTHGRTTEPTDSPPNATYRARLEQPALLGRYAFREGGTFGRSQATMGELVLKNGDGDLDGLLAYGFDGRQVVVKRGAPSDAYTAFETVLTGTMETAEVTSDVVRIRLRDTAADLDVPLQPTKYAGDNVLPNGLEGTADDLAGKPKPICLGTVQNVPAVLVNSAKLIYQVNDGPVASIDMVYDRGIPLLGRGEFLARTVSFGGDVYAVAYADGQFVAVGASDDVATSPDGITWTHQTTGHGSATWRAVAFGAGLWVIVGHSGVLYSSPDGVTWTSRTSGFGADHVLGVCFGGGQFVAVGFAGKISTSPDGITWTAASSLGGAVVINGVAFGGNLFVLGTDTGVIYTSTNGTSWTARTSSSGDSIKAITWAQGYYIAVGGNGAGGNARIATSVDGLIWTDRVNPFGTTQLWAVGWGPGEFFVGGTGKIGLSPDGVTWSEFTNPFGAEEVYGVSFGDTGYGITVIVGGTNNVSSTYASATDYGDMADLLNDALAPAPARYKAWKAGGYFRLGSTPDGLITADVTQGAGSGDRTVASLFRSLLWRPWVTGGTLAQWSDDHLAALDTAFAHVCGFWTDRETTVAQAVDLAAQSAGAWWAMDRYGVLIIEQLTAPSGDATLSLNQHQVVGLERLPANDQGRGIPCYRSVVRWGRLYAVQDDVAGGVSDARRGELAREWREASAEDTSVQTAHPLAPQIIEDSLLATEAGAQAEATRRQALRGTRRDPFRFACDLSTTTDLLELGDVIDLTHDRFGLSSGELCRVLGLEPDTKNHRLFVMAWR